MAIIKIISGGYGLEKNGTIDLKTVSSPEFEVSDSEARRLQEIGVAKIVQNNTVATAQNDEATQKPSVTKGSIEVPKKGKNKANNAKAKKEDKAQADMPSFSAKNPI